MKLEDLNLVSVSETGIDIEPLSGVSIKISGPYARKARIADIAYFRKINMLPSDISPDEFANLVDDYAVERSASRIIGWTGIEEEFTYERALELCKINPAIKMMIIRESDAIEGFTKSK